MRRREALLLASVLLIGCGLPGAHAAQDNSAPASLDRPFTLKPGTAATVGNERVQVRFERILSDSRCPKDVQCIQAGEAVLRVQMTAPGKARETFEVTTNPAGSSVSVANYSLKLTLVEPQPVSGRQARSDEYRATFVLSKL